MKSSQQIFRISISLVALTMLIFLMAHWLGMVPDKDESQLRERVNIAESLAVVISASIKHTNLDIVQDSIQEFSQHNRQIKSILLAEKEGDVIATYGDYPRPGLSMRSTINHLKVPIYKDGEVWGVVEVVFLPLHENIISAYIGSSFYQLIIFITVFGFILYALLIRRVLSHLDPYKTVPARVQKTLDALSEGVALVNDEERIVVANKVFESKFDFKINRMLGRKLSEIGLKSSTNNVNQIVPWIVTLKKGTDYENVRLSYKSTANETRIFSVNCTPLKDAKGNIKGALASFNEVTELEKVSEDLSDMSKMLRHEIYNALIGASGMVQLLDKSSSLTEGDKQLVTLAQKSLSVIKNLLESIREANSIESSFTKEEVKTLRLDTLVEEIVSGYASLYSGHTFVFEAGGEELLIRGQEERIIQMLGKLASNAVDHSDVNTPIVFSCEKVSDKAVIKIKNQGKFLPENKESIFDLFASFRIGLAKNENQGIGLYIVRLIVETYGGSVEARDRGDVPGAEFIISLPVINVQRS